MGSVSEVIDAAEQARQRGSVFLCAELLQLAEVLLVEVDHLGTNASRLAVSAVAELQPIGAHVAYATERANARDLTHALLAGGADR
jgi:hypothetical protein